MRSAFQPGLTRRAIRSPYPGSKPSVGSVVIAHAATSATGLSCSGSSPYCLRKRLASFASRSVTKTREHVMATNGKVVRLLNVATEEPDKERTTGECGEVIIGLLKPNEHNTDIRLAPRARLPTSLHLLAASERFNAPEGPRKALRRPETLSTQLHHDTSVSPA